MLDYRLWQFVGIFVACCTILLILLLVLQKHRGRIRVWGFILLSIVPLAFVILAINYFRAYQSNPYFVELGQFFPIPDRSNVETPPITIGDNAHYPDVLLSGFEGLFELSYERQTGTGDAPNNLVIETVDLKQPLTLYEVTGRNNKESRQVISGTGRQRASLPIHSPAQFRIVIESHSENATGGDSVAVEVVIRVEDALLIVYHPQPFRFISLAGLPKHKNEKGEEVRLVRITDDPDPVVDVDAAQTFLATISVRPTRQAGNVRTFLELPIQAQEGTDGPRDFVVNNGLTKLGYSFGTEVLIGSQRGTLITVAAPSAPVGKWILIILLLWALPIFSFLSSSFISRSNGLWMLLPILQMLLAVRIVLSVRTYLFPPYNAEGVESALWGALFIPLMIFCGLFGATLRLLFERGSETDSGRFSGLKRTYSFFKSFPPFYYWLSTIVILPLIYYLLQSSSQRTSYLFNFTKSFEWSSFSKPMWLLVAVPPLIWGGTLAIHWWITRRYVRSGGEENKNYGAPTHDPILYALENPPAAAGPEPDKPRRKGRIVSFLRGILRLHKRLRAWSGAVSAALESILVILILIGVLGVFSLLGLRSKDILLRAVPMRTSAAFQLLGLILTIRLLAIFFYQDWQRLNDPLRGRGLWGYLVIFIAPLLFIALPYMASSDAGSILVNWPPLLGMALVVTGSSIFLKKVPGKWRWASIGLASLLLLGVALVFSGTKSIPGLSDLLVEKMPKSTITQRVLIREGQRRAERAALMGGTGLIGAMEQFWMMSNYAANGGQIGYKQDDKPAIVPVPEGKWDNRGKPIDARASFALVSLSDAVFSVYVLGEHGFWGGLCLILLYLLLFVVVSRKAIRSFPDSVMRITLLIGVALAIVFPAIYVAAANVNGAIFTGQDMPLLGLRSHTDLLHNGLLLLLLASGLATAGLSSQPLAAESTGWQIAKRNRVFLILLLVVPTLWTIWCMRDIAIVNQEKNKDTFTLEYLNEELQGLIDKGYIRAKMTGARNELDYDRGMTRAITGDVLGELISKYNGRTQRGDEHDEGQWFQIDTKSGTVTVNRTRYYHRSPFRAREKWQGAITEGNEKPTDVLSGAGINLRLKSAPANDQLIKPGATIETVNLNTPQPNYPSSRGFRVIDRVADKNGTLRERTLFRIYTVAGADGAVLAPESDIIYLNGVRLFHEGRSLPVRLDYMDTIAVAAVEDNANPKRELERPPRYLFTFQHSEPATFSYVAWFNGETQRVYPQSDALPMALLTAEAIERETTERTLSLPLTLNSKLNREVYELLGEWRAGVPRPRRPVLPPIKEGTSRRMAVTLMNPENGDLLALASDNGNTYYPEDEDDARRLRTQANAINGNFMRHIIGSTVKPFTAAATLYSYPSLTEMTIIDQRADKRTVFGKIMGDGQRGDAKSWITTRGRRTSVGWNDFLPFSDNLYAVALGLIGLTQQDGSGSVPFSNKDAQGLHMQFGTGPVQRNQPLFVNDVFSDDADKQFNVGNLELTPLAGNYVKLFGVRHDAKVNDYDTGVWDNAQSLGLLRSVGDNANLFAVSPARTNLNLTHVSKTWELRSILLGGGVEGDEKYGNLGSEWCNVLMGQAFSRIVMGKEVKARIVLHEQQPFQGWNETAPWRFELLRGLEGVANTPGGTAYDEIHAFSTRINRSPSGNGGDRYFTVFSKTGTLYKDELKGTVPDTIYIFAAGFWNNSLRRLEGSVVGVIYLEQGGAENSQKFARELLELLNQYYRWDAPAGRS